MSGVWLASYIVLWLVVLLLAFLLAGALRQLGLLQLRLGDDPGALITDTGLERGTEAPDFAALDAASGEPVSLSDLPAVPRMLVFASPGCLSCRELIPGLNEVPMMVDTNGQIEKDYAVTLTPFAYVIDHEGRVVIRGLANDWRQLESLLEQEGTLQAAMRFAPVDGEPAGITEEREG
jgi:hypothetical protein